MGPVGLQYKQQQAGLPHSGGGGQQHWWFWGPRRASAPGIAHPDEAAHSGLAAIAGGASGGVHGSGTGGMGANSGIGIVIDRRVSGLGPKQHPSILQGGWEFTQVGRATGLAWAWATRCTALLPH